MLLRSMQVISLILGLPALKLHRKGCVFSTLSPSPLPHATQQASSLVHCWTVLLLSWRVSGLVLIKGQRGQAAGQWVHSLSLCWFHTECHTLPFVAPESLEQTLKGYEWESPVFSPATLPFALLLVRRCSFGELLLLSLPACGSHGAGATLQL